MATLGLKYCAWAKIKEETSTAIPTYNPGKVIGKAVSTSLEVTNAEAELSADDMVAEYVSEFSSAALTMEVDNIELADQAEMYGATYQDEELQHLPEDTAPYGGIGGYQVLLVHGVRKYRSWIFPKAKASIPNWTGQTKGSSITLGTQPISMKVVAPSKGPWYRVKEFLTEAEAQAYVDNYLGVSSWHKVSVQINGEVKPDCKAQNGVTYVAAGKPFEIEVGEQTTAVYDNGTDNQASVAEKKYKIEAVNEDHAIAVVFSAPVI